MLALFALWQDATQAPPETATQPTGPAQQPQMDWSFLILPLMLFAIFYLLVFRPQRKQQKARTEMLSQIKKGDRVLTSGGMIGTIVALKDEEATLEVDQNVRIRFSRGAIVQVITADEKAKEPVAR